MGYFLLKAALSGMIIAIVSEVARRAPALAIGCTMTVLLYLAMVWALGHFGVRL